MLIDLRTKYPEITGKLVENTLVNAEITVNKNMVPFDDKSPFVTSGIRVGTAAVTTRGLKEDDMGKIVGFIDKVLQSPEDDESITEVGHQVNQWMSDYPLYESMSTETA